MASEDCAVRDYLLELGFQEGWIRQQADILAEFGIGRLKVHAAFDGVPYDGSVVNMGIRNADGSICYIIGVRKDIQKQMEKSIGDLIHVTLSPVL